MMLQYRLYLFSKVRHCLLVYEPNNSINRKYPDNVSSMFSEANPSLSLKYIPNLKLRTNDFGQDSNSRLGG